MGSAIARGIAALGLLTSLGWSEPLRAHPGAHERRTRLDARVHEQPRDVELRLRRAALRRELGHHREALDDLRVAESLEPGRREIGLERARIELSRGRPAAAERELDRVLAAGPPHQEALVLRSAVREADGRLRQARDDLDVAISLGGRPELYLDRGRLDERLGRLDDAAQGYRDGLAELGPAVVLRLALVGVELRRDPARALPEVDALLEQDPLRADWILLRAEALDGMGHAATASIERLRALVAAEAALRRRPTPLHRLALAQVHLALEQPQLARRELALALADAPTLAAALALRDRLDALPEEP